MPLKDILEVKIFDVWVMDFMWSFPSSNGHRYIFVAINYVSSRSIVQFKVEALSYEAQVQMVEAIEVVLDTKHGVVDLRDPEVMVRSQSMGKELNTIGVAAFVVTKLRQTWLMLEGILCIMSRH